LTPLEIETTFTAIGLQAILRAKPRMGRTALRKAAELPNVVRRALLRFVASDSWEPAADLLKIDYRELLPIVSAKKLNKVQVDALNAAVPDADLALDLSNKADGILAWANGIIPREPPDPVTGQPTSDPPPGALLDFRRAWQVACDPMSVLADLADGSLFDDQVAVIALHFPETYKVTLVEAEHAIATMVARRGKSWSLGPTKAAYLRTLRQQSDIDPQLTQMMQTAYAADEAQQAQAPKPRAGAAPKGGGQESTPGQQAAGASPT
jgi:hypothetical protein